MKIRKEYTCPLEVAHDIIKGKWKPVILYQLYRKGPLSLSELENNIKGISQKMLLQQLKELKEFGLIGKNNFEGYPLRVEYFLSENKCARIIEALEILQEIGREYLEEKNKN